ncbi:hypothetical protein ACFHYQ_22070 [Sphaerimonospora cavernae]|uniref:DUF3108 domain-containing protein n=1 Tax=Sphaerimonospora cavernae TaxID=1740611 RepID=A0ABV6U9Z4_9ACTN
MRLSVVAPGIIAVLFIGTTPAQAIPHPIDPAQSIKSQFKGGHGVLISEVATATYKGIKGTTKVATNGSIGFNASGAVNYDLTTGWTSSPQLLELLGFDSSEDKSNSRTHAIKVGKYTYVSPFEWGERPEGRPWTRFGGKNNASWQDYGQRGSQLADVIHPKRLKFALSKAIQVRPGEYRGTLRTEDLYAELGPMNPDRHTISFRLFLNKAGLPIRLITEYKEKDSLPTMEGKEVKTIRHEVVDTRYYRWGVKVKIAPPPAKEVVDWKDLPGPSFQNEQGCFLCGFQPRALHDWPAKKI